MAIPQIQYTFVRHVVSASIAQFGDFAGRKGILNIERTHTEISMTGQRRWKMGNIENGLVFFGFIFLLLKIYLLSK